MALARTNRTAQTSSVGFGTGSFTSSAFTPNDNSLLVVRGAFTHASGDTGEGTSLTITDSVGLTWTSRVANTSSPGWGYGNRVWTAPVTTGTSMTVSIGTGGLDVYAYRLETFDYTGYDPDTPVGGTATGTDADGNGAASITLDQTPASTSEVLGFASISMDTSDNAVTQGSGFTEIYDVFLHDWHGWHAESRTGSTSTTVDWVDLSTSGTPAGANMVALEIREDDGSSGGGVTFKGKGIQRGGVLGNSRGWNIQ